MQKIFSLIRSSKFYYAILLPVVILAVFSAFLLKYSASSPAEADRKRIVGSTEQIRQLVVASNGNPTDQDLIRLEEKFPNSKTGSLARFLRGYLHYNKSDFSVSAKLFDADFISQGSVLSDYALYYQGRSYREIGEFNKAIATFSQLAEKYPDSLLARNAEIAVGEITLNQLNDANTAIKKLSRLTDSKDATALFLTAQAYEKLQKTDLAVEFYKKLYFQVPQSSEADLAEKRLIEQKYLPETSKSSYELYQTRAQELFRAGQYARTTETYTSLKTNFPNQAVSANNELELGISFYKLNRFREAVTPLQNVSNSNKEDYLQARYYLANSYLKQKQMGQFAEVANQVLTTLKPSSEQAASLLGAMVEYYQIANESLATRYRNQLIQNYPNSKEADEISYKPAWKIHQQKRYAEASEALVEHLANIPNTDFRGPAIFWAARNAEKAGQPSKAVALYEALLKRYKYNYYGYLTEQYLGQLKKQGVKAQKAAEGSQLARAIENLKPASPLPETATDKVVPYLKKAEQLHEIGLDDQAFSEIEFVRKEFPTSHKVNFAQAAIYRDRGENFRAVDTLKKAHPDYSIYQGDEVSQEVYDIFFPLIEWETIQTEAKRHGLDPYTVAGLIRQESVFDPRAKSRANALGLMQLLPSTGQLVARKQGAGKITNEQLYNPKLNIQLGTAYLAEMLDKYGKIEYAAAAYNGGPGRVSKWLTTLPTSNIEDWVESIPITETRLYVFGVIRNSQQYKRIYGKSQTAQK
ncbi:MAG: transglycosylase SLT domain-containing protein [Blastocatellia bacterium]|nr:transglycosylase SLT domain-containing protein [Blastocatellia bacterium]